MNIKLDIPEDFFKGEERCGYYVSPEMKRVWAVQLDLITEFARVCEKYNLKWYADGGTLLGAARHKGFIPWDDDVDLIMFRKDFIRLCEIADKEFKAPYHFASFESDKKERLMPFGKLHNNTTTMLEYHEKDFAEHGIKFNYSQGIYIDIFILDDIPDDENEAKKMFTRAHKLVRKASTLQKFEKYYSARTKWKRPLKFIIFKFIQILSLLNIKLPPSLGYYEEFVECIHSYHNPESKHLGQLAFLADKGTINTNIWERSWFEKTVYLPFEMLTLPADIGYENRLTKIYGDWHKYVIKERHSAFYDTEKPYTYYIQKKSKE